MTLRLASVSQACFVVHVSTLRPPQKENLPAVLLGKSCPFFSHRPLKGWRCRLVVQEHSGCKGNGRLWTCRASS